METINNSSRRMGARNKGREIWRREKNKGGRGGDKNDENRKVVILGYEGLI